MMNVQNLGILAAGVTAFAVMGKDLLPFGFPAFGLHVVPITLSDHMKEERRPAA